MSLQLKNHGESWLQEDDSTTKAENNKFTLSTNPKEWEEDAIIPKHTQIQIPSLARLEPELQAQLRLLPWQVFHSKKQSDFSLQEDD